jgi:hypothetical protein
VKHFDCIVLLQRSGCYTDQNVEHILLNILLHKLSCRIYVTLSETEGLSWEVNMYDSGTRHLKFWYSPRGTAENLWYSDWEPVQCTTKALPAQTPTLPYITQFIYKSNNRTVSNRLSVTQAECLTSSFEAHAAWYMGPRNTGLRPEPPPACSVDKRSRSLTRTWCDVFILQLCTKWLILTDCRTVVPTLWHRVALPSYRPQC